MTTIITFVFAFLALACFPHTSAYYLPGTYPREFKRGEHVQGKERK